MSQTHAGRQTVGLVVRAILVVALAIILVGGMRWAMGVTNANTHLISSNLNGMQSRFDRSAARAAEEATERADVKVRDAKRPEAVSGAGIEIEPVASDTKP